MHRIETPASGVRERRRIHRSKGKTSPDQAAADALVRMPAQGQPIVVELVDVVTAVTVMFDEKSVVDLVQGHTAGSPDAVSGTPTVGDAADKGRVFRQIVRPESVASRNAPHLCPGHR